jgi:hypothetical protein
MKTKVYHQLCLTLFFILFFAKGYSQTNNTPSNAPSFTPTVNHNVNRPTDTLGINEVDLYVTKCYDFYDLTNILSTQLNTIEQQVFINKLSDMDTKSIEVQLNTFKAQLGGLKVAGNALAESGSEMTDKVSKSLKNKPFKIPGAIVRVKNATKAVKISLQNIYTMLTVTLVNINRRINPKNAADSAQNKSNTGNSIAQAKTGKTIKTSISITGIGFSSFNSLSNELSNISSIKSTTKKFNSSGTSVIDVVHYGTTDDLLIAILSSCKDVVSDKNVGSSEKGKISLAF